MRQRNQEKIMDVLHLLEEKYRTGWRGRELHGFGGIRKVHSDALGDC